MGCLGASKARSMPEASIQAWLSLFHKKSSSIESKKGRPFRRPFFMILSSIATAGVV
jgi:hypothetical protein